MKKKITFFEVEAALKESVELLQSSAKSSMVSYYYNSQNDLIKAQKEFIEYGWHCVNFADYVNYDLKKHYYSILTNLFKRGELELGQVGFFGKDSAAGSMVISGPNMAANMNTVEAKELKERQKIASKYSLLLMYTLNYSLQKLARKELDFYKRDFLELFLAVAYFRIPEFRQKFLECLL